MDPSSIKAWAGALAPYAAFFTTLWAVFTYRRAKKVEVARLQKQIFDDLHLSGKFDRIREALDFDYSAVVEPALDRVIEPRGNPIPRNDRSLLLDLDNFLKPYRVRTFPGAGYEAANQRGEAGTALLLARLDART